MENKAQIMIQPPVATNLVEIADLWEHMQNELDTPPLPEQKMAFEQQLRDLYRDPAVFILTGVRMPGVAMAEGAKAGEVVAFMIARMEDGNSGQPRFGRLIGLYVQPSLRGNNLAQHMVEAASGWMRAQGCAYLEAGTVTSNRRGMAFLARTQFQLHSSVLRKKL